jgi:hypothetical protein
MAVLALVPILLIGQPATAQQSPTGIFLASQPVSAPPIQPALGAPEQLPGTAQPTATPSPGAPAASAPGHPSTPQGTVQPPPLVESDIYSASFKVLFVLFVLAVLIESGLAVIFNWRPFLELFDARGVKTLVAIGFSYFFVEAFDFDVTTRLVNVYSSTNYPVNLPGKIVTALVLAGGSSGVNNLLIALGFRQISAQRQDTPRPPPQEAWIAVRLRRRLAKGPVTVRIGTDANALPVAGTIAGSARPGGRLLGYFVRDQGRFPTSGGYPVAAGQTYTVRMEGVDQAAAPVAVAAGASWGPYPLAAGALINLELSL